MVLPLFLAATDANPAIGSIIALDGPEGKHAVSVRRMRVGEGIQVANGKGQRIIGVVASTEQASLKLRVEQVVQEVAPEPGIILVQALAKGDRDELAIQAATELGCSGIVPWQADRSVSRWEGAKIAKGVDRWQTIVTEAAKQALRAFVPQVAEPVSSKQLVASVSSYDLVLVLDPTAESALSKATLPTAGSVAIVVGPEGGIAESELEALAAAGAQRVRLGGEILRTSTAGMAAISVLQTRLNRW
ncbi:MAG: hypothetical protein RJA35_739 [Actinomycetota bacterium]|jgi:16S rRNA (uracil1498-N3)-methyltransferase